MASVNSKLTAFVAVFAIMLSAFAVVPIVSDDSDAAPAATYNLTASVGTYYSFDTNIPSNYALPSNSGWSLATHLPKGMSLNSGGDIVGTPLVPGYYNLNYYLNGVGSASNVTGGKYIEVKLNVTGSPDPSIGTSISGPVTVNLNKYSSVFESYQTTSSYFEVLGDKFNYYFNTGLSDFDYINAYGGALVIEDYDYEGGISIYPCVFNYGSATVTNNSTLFSNVTYSNGTMSFKFNPASYGTFAVGLHIVAEGPGYGGGYDEYILTNVFTYAAQLDVDDITVYTGQSISIPNVVSSGSISVSGVSWLRASGTSIVGTAPATAGSYTVTVSSNGASDTFVVKVITRLAFTSVPSNGVIAYAL